LFIGNASPRSPRLLHEYASRSKHRDARPSNSYRRSIAPTLRTPGVFVQPTGNPGASIVAVEAALPCFIGNAEKARDSAAAYQVQVGLGSTMTSEDMLNGIMRIQLTLAVTHPAEFIQLAIDQQMQRNS
jgi:hypothetical protein